MAVVSCSFPPIKHATKLSFVLTTSSDFPCLIKMPLQLLELPDKILTKIYLYLLDNCGTEHTVGYKYRVEPEHFAVNRNLDELPPGPRRIDCHPAILRTCKKIHREAAPLLYSTKVFVVNDRIDRAISAYHQLIPNIPTQHLQHIRLDVQHEVVRWPFYPHISEARRIMEALPALREYNLDVDFNDIRRRFGRLVPKQDFANRFAENVIEMARKVLLKHPSLSKLYQEIARIVTHAGRTSDGMEKNDDRRCFIFVSKTIHLGDGKTWERSRCVSRAANRENGHRADLADKHRICCSKALESAHSFRNGIECRALPSSNCATILVPISLSESVIVNLERGL